VLDRELAAEMWPRDNTFRLCAERATVDEAIKRARDTDGWPSLQYLWPLHPVMQWLDYKLLSAFGRNRAPVLRARGLAAGEAIVLTLAQAPNRRGQTMLSQWFGVRLAAQGGSLVPAEVLDLPEVLRRTGLDGNDDDPVPNDGRAPDLAPLQRALAAVVAAAREHFQPRLTDFRARNKTRLEAELARLQTLRDRHERQLEIDFAHGIEQVRASERRKRESETADLFDNYKRWTSDTLILDDHPQITVVAALVV